MIYLFIYFNLTVNHILLINAFFYITLQFYRKIFWFIFYKVLLLIKQNIVS